MKFGLTVYGTVYDMGIHPQSGKPRITPAELIDVSAANGLEGIEVPYAVLKAHDPDEVARCASDKGMFINIAAGGYDAAVLKDALELGEMVGAVTVRTVVGGAKFGGDRRHMAGTWNSFLDDILAGFQAAVETAERTGVNLAVENHQDLASEELLWLCDRIGSDRFGITLDTGNPLATAEEPIEFFNKVAPFVKNVHLKDYWIYWSEEGYRLVRCPVGQGVINFPELLRIFNDKQPDVTMSLEHGALEARHVRVLEEDYWTEYPERSAKALARLMRFVHDQAKVSGDWRTPWEKGEPPEAIAAYERAQLDTGVAYLTSLIRRVRSSGL
ncbi:sugar phosphate isomerase/epimerase family protein [Paenibacillus xerothermodurans]|uniref:Sugar phosphate isomerase/epimerase n=1 Tax=Paenibacillus xerothermodurans TaxID=1977292 RepID=A0A2W1NCQ3_PAEXE|nr:sugar phosphate isomerase/epimerase [Paenibacillus xerothermodurans]PZE22277.1 sugar phosphate isomerase/epimerase [Paenibacillus xerothermodurans]